jgi:hypothetical protein
MINIFLRKLRCHVETDEVGADEPYALVTAVDLRGPQPQFDVVRYGPFGDVDAREEHFAPGMQLSFWGLGDRSPPADLSDPEKAIFVVAPMENDNGNTEVLRGVVKGTVAASLAGSAGMNRPEIVSHLIRDIGAVLRTPTSVGLNLDDQIGPPWELRFSAQELRDAEAGRTVSKPVRFQGDGGDYTFTFEAVRSHRVIGAIRDKWMALRAESGPLALPVGVELPTFDSVGRAQPFQGGLVSWHPETGANAVWGLIGQRWLQIGREAFGYPLTDELWTPDGRGRFNHFRAVHLPGKPDSSIYWSPESGAHEVYGAIRAKWAAMGWERSQLRYPIAAEQDHAGGRIQRFQGGGLFWARATGVVSVV